MKPATFLRFAAVSIAAVLFLHAATLRAANPTITVQPVGQSVAASQNATFSVTATDTLALSYQWQKNGTAIAGATSATYVVSGVQSAQAGLYLVVVSTSAGSTTSDAALLGVTTTSKVIGAGSEIAQNVFVAANNNTVDQVLLSGAAASVTADANQITRTSFIDLNNDIVQVEFSGSGTLSLVLDTPSGPALPVNYNQSVSYMKGHVGLVITGANETTNVAVFSVGRITAVNQTLFKPGVIYDGLADLAFIAISSTNGKFGSVRTANASYSASKGLTGIYAPGVQFTGPVYVGDINASGTATPVLILGSASDTRITGGDLLQTNALPVKVSGITQLKFTDGSTSHGVTQYAKTNRAVLQQNGVDVTTQLVEVYDLTRPSPMTAFEPPQAASVQPGGSSGCVATQDDLLPYLFSGEFHLAATDLVINGLGLDFVWARKYRSKVGRNTAQGNGWDFSYNIQVAPNGPDYIVYDGNGRMDTYRVQADGTYGADQLFCEGTLSKAVFTLKFPDNGTWEFLPFNGSPNQGKIGRITDRNSNTLVFDYSADGLLTNIVDTLGRNIQVGYNADGFVSSITDFANRRVTYTYYQNNDAGGSFGDLKSVTSPAITGTLNGNDFPSGKTVTYTYSKGFADDSRNHKLLTITDAKGQTWLSNTYAATTNRDDFNYGRLMSQMRGYSNEVLTFFYNPQPPLAANQFAVTSAIVNDRVGNVSEYLFDPMNNLVRLRQFTGRAVPGVTTTETQNRPTGKLRASDPDFFETRHEWNVDSRPTRTVFPNGNSVTNTYELVLTPNASRRFRGNLRARTSLPGPLGGDQAAINETFVYDITFGGCCGFNFVTQATDGRGNTTYHSYDSRGNRTSTIHNIPSVVESFEYNAFGQMTAHVLPDNGSGHRRRDQMDYYQGGPQSGYLQKEIQDVGGRSLTTTFEYDSVGNPVRQIDSRGKDTLYAVNTLNQVVRETSREVTDGSVIRYLRDSFYDANNNMEHVDVQNLNEAGYAPTNKPAFTTFYEYDILNMPIRVSQEVDVGTNLVTEYAYDPNRNLTLFRYGEVFAGLDTNNVERTTVFDERRLPLDVTRGQGAGQSTTRNDYDGNRNLTRVSHGTESDPRVTTHSYDGYNRRTAMVDAMGNVQTSRFDANGNLVFERTDGELDDSPGGANNVRLAEMSYSYDAMNRKTNTVAAYFDPATGQPIGGGQSVSQTIYSGTSQVTQQIDAQGNRTTNDYDTANRLRTMTDAKSNTTTYTYDDRSRVTQISQVDKSDLGSPNQTFITTNSYDNLDRLIQSVDNIGNTSRWGYDSRNNRTLAIDGRGNVTRFAFDGLNRLIQTTRELTDTGEGSGKIIKSIVTSQAWDDSSRLISQTDDNGNTTRYVYDALNRLVRTVFADGTTNSVIYDVHDNAVSMTDANGSVATLYYDQLNRVTYKLVSRAVGVLGTRFEYYQYDGLSRVVLAGNDDSEVTRGYDSLSHVTIETQQVFPGGLVRTIARAYDNVGNQVSCTYPGGRVAACAYDALNRKQTITDALGDLARYSYFGPGRVQRSDHGNGTRADLGYDGVRRLTSTLHTRVADGAVIDSRSYGWDAANNKTAATDLLPLAQDSRSYRYDSASRLVHSETAVVGPVIDYALDGVGNRRQVSGGAQPGAYFLNTSVPPAPPADAPVNQYTTTPFDARTYDANGNLTQAGPQRFTYDYKNRLVAASRLNGVSYINTLTAKYDCFERRIEKAAPGATARYYYAAWQEIEEQNGANATVATYVWGRGIDELVEMERNGQSYFYHGDDLGSVRKVTNATGNVVEQYNYGDYGEPRFFNATGAALSGTQIGNFTLFIGRRYDPETGLYYYRTRYLDPNAGRFTTRDMIGIWGDEGNLGNETAYVGNNPGTWSDPNGAQPNWCALRCEAVLAVEIAVCAASAPATGPISAACVYGSLAVYAICLTACF